jgi:hypothetical protein
MRKPRVILFDDWAEKKSSLKQFFDARGYEMIVVTQSELCPFYGKKAASAATCGRLCCDIAVVVEKGPRMDAIQLLTSPFHHGCALKPRHQAIISGTITDDQRMIVEAIGAAVFRNPLDLAEFEAWVKSFRDGMDLSVPLAVMRKAQRRACTPGTEVHYRVLQGGEVRRARALNLSSCGICIRTPQDLKLRQVIHLWSEEPLLSEDAEVRWIRQAGDGTLLAGLTFCVV